MSASQAKAIIENVLFSITTSALMLILAIHYRKRKVQSLLQKVDNLEKMTEDVELLVQIAQRKGDILNPVVEAWLAKVYKFLREETAFDVRSTMLKNFVKWFYSPIFNNPIVNLIDIAEDLLNQRRSFSSISPPALPPSSIQSIISSSTEHFLDFESRESAKNQIIQALKDEKIKVIGVYGMAGVGKTTLMKQVETLVRQQYLYDEVLIVTVSHNPVLKNIQDEIAERLGMKFEQESEWMRARKLWMRLKQEKRLLIILDDLWKPLDLADVGISYGDYHKGCKVVITMRNLNLCGHMNAKAKIEVNVLSKQDSWNLFRQVVGDTVESPALLKFATEVVNQCGGLPFAIVTVGSALQNKDQIVWEDAARQLRQSTFHDMQNVNSSIRLSYDYLVREETKRCFLFCCLFPRDFKFTTDELLLYVMGDELLRDEATLKEARNRLHGMLDILVSSCLLLKEEDNGPVMMHGVVRSAAISIAQEEINGFIVKADVGLRRWPDAENLRRFIHMSLIKNKISKFPNQPEYPRLLTLSLSRSFSFERLPDGFFERMTSLVTLDLKRTDISSLPPSLLCLVSLRTLLLDHTSLSDISLVTELKELEILSLSNNKIERLPEEMGKLTNLKLLDLSKNPVLKTIPPKMFSSFSCLEELYMMGSFDAWEIDEIGDGYNARLTELASLKYMTILDIDISDVRCLSKDISINWGNLTKFRICGSGRGSEWKPKFPRAMRLNITSAPLSNWVKLLLNQTEELDLYDCRRLKNIVQLDRGRFNILKFLRIRQCIETRYLMNVVEPSEAAFSNLEVLDIQSMNNLEAIHFGPLPNGFLEKLKLLSLRDCLKITNVLSSDLLARMQNLEKLDVVMCGELKEVFDSEELEEGHASIANLKELHLHDLPKLTTIWKGMWKIIQSEENEEEGEIIEEEVLETTATSSTRLREIKYYYVSSNFPSSPIFPNLKVLEISSCHMLKHLFPIELVRDLFQLQVLKIKNCEEMEEIILSNEEDEEDERVLPQLKTLELVYLPKLSNVHQRGLLFDWPSLEELRVEECPNLSRLPLGYWSAPKLRKIEGVNAESFDWEDPRVREHPQPLFKQK